LPTSPNSARPGSGSAARPSTHPGRIFPWWFHFDAYAPIVFDEAGGIAAAGGFLGCGAAIAGSVWRARQRRNVTTYGSARWASQATSRRGVWQPRRASSSAARLALSSPRRPGARHGLRADPLRQGRRPRRADPARLDGLDGRPRHQGRELAADRRLARALLALPAVQPDRCALGAVQPAARGSPRRDEVRDVQNIADILVDPKARSSAATIGRRPATRCWSARSSTSSTPRRRRRSPASRPSCPTPQRPFVATLADDDDQSSRHEETPLVHPVVASAAREVLNKSDNERSGVLSTAMSFLGLYRDPTVAAVTAASDWRIADLVEAASGVALSGRAAVGHQPHQAAHPPRAQPDRPPADRAAARRGRRRRRHKLLMMLDEFPALGRLDFFETSLAFLAGYGVRAFLIAQSLNQIEKAYGEHNAILDNCHVRVAFATNDERTAKRISDALGTATEQRAMRNYAGHRLAPWLAHVMVSRQETARALLTPGEVMQLPRPTSWCWSRAPADPRAKAALLRGRAIQGARAAAAHPRRTGACRPAGRLAPHDWQDRRPPGRRGWPPS
jgi:type IV secretion system protein VirD4